jgi:hypothetical protein
LSNALAQAFCEDKVLAAVLMLADEKPENLNQMLE